MSQPAMQPRRRANENAFAWSFAVAALWIPAGIAIVFATLGVPDSAYAAGRTTGLIVIPVVAAGLITGGVARSSRTAWTWWHYLLTGLAIAVWLTVFLAYARVAGG